MNTAERMISTLIGDKERLLLEVDRLRLRNEELAKSVEELEFMNSVLMEKCTELNKRLGDKC